MRRDYFTLDVETAERERPVVNVEFDGPDGLLAERLTDESGAPLDAADIDVSYRLREPVDESAWGVLAVSNRYTGAFLFELDTSADVVFDLVRAARDGEESDGQFRLVVDHDRPLLDVDVDTLLVYDENGGLLRRHSLVSSGVEL
ncbi:DUF5793 family protein [Halomarina rubra]|uniref:DUF5793 family protein n=1 Tax=Halomarina rubra TaxID=2071873 RepID=A0ABD6B007_9EURY|nr:DUF5793 family protein [Halomarina rubra]